MAREAGAGRRAPSAASRANAVSTCDLTGGQKKAEPARRSARERERESACGQQSAAAAAACVVSLSPAADATVAPSSRESGGIQSPCLPAKRIRSIGRSHTWASSLLK